MLSDSAVNRARHWFAVLTAAATLGLILAGGLVTSHGVGMSVPDWPNTYGYNLFFFPISKWAGGIFYEHSHRLVASGVGLLTVILAIWLHGRAARPLLRWGGGLLSGAGLGLWGVMPGRWSDAVVVLAVGVAGLAASVVWSGGEPAPKWLRRLGILAVVAVIAQGVLGGLRVTQIRDELGIFHAALAQAFFCLMCAIALFTSPWWAKRRPADTAAARCLAPCYVTASCLILAQLVLGATMRHQHAGLAIPDFPLAYGKVWPDTDPAAVERYNQRRMEIVAVRPITGFQIELQMAHRLLATVVVAAVFFCAWQTFARLGRNNLWSVLTLGWAGLISLQVILGAVTIWSDKAADIATAHVFVGALSLALGSLICIVSIRTALDIMKVKAAFDAAREAPDQPPGPRISAAN